MSAQSQSALNGPQFDEEYGSDNLPVLIRLPNLSDSVDETSPPPCDVEDEPAESHLTHPDTDREPQSDERATIPITSSVPEPVSQSAASEEASEGQAVKQLRQQRERRRQRASRRNERRPIPSWLRGVRQLIVAAALAGALLVVIVVMKNGRAPTDAPDRVEPIVEAPTLDFNDAVTDATPGKVEENPIGPSLHAPTLTDYGPSASRDNSSEFALPERSLPNERPVLNRDQNATVAGPASPSPGTISYPSTGIPGPPSSGGGWSETISVGRAAERPAPATAPRHR